MLGITQLKMNTKIELDGDPYVVLQFQHAKMGRGGAVVRTKLKNLKTGATVAKTFQGNDKVQPARLDSRTGQYLYSDGGNYTFMDTGNFEQFTIPSSVVSEQVKLLKEGLEVQLLQFKGQVIAVELPIKVSYKVTETDPGLKGDTAAGGTKPATLESGASVNVPLFVQIGDSVVVDTRTITYVERVS
ncbi:elongation factor P [Patescibacteria group bacterium]|nr:elongation factor P [Patescibacteria group bacterium]